MPTQLPLSSDTLYLPKLEPLTHADVMNAMDWFQRILISIPLCIMILIGLVSVSSGRISTTMACMMLVTVLSSYLLFLGIRKVNTGRAYHLKISQWLPSAGMPPTPDTLEGEDLVAGDVMLVSLLARKSMLDGHKSVLLQELVLPATMDEANTCLARCTAWNWEMEEYAMRVESHNLMLQAYLAEPR